MKKGILFALICFIGCGKTHAQLVTDDIYHATLAASVITILLNGLLMRALPKTAT